MRLAEVVERLEKDLEVAQQRAERAHEKHLQAYYSNEDDLVVWAYKNAYTDKVDEVKRIRTELYKTKNGDVYNKSVACDYCDSDKPTRSFKTDMGYSRFRCKSCDDKAQKIYELNQ